MCTCGTPSKATHYVSYVVGNDTLGETEERSGYYCDDHVPSESDVASVYPLDGWQLIEDAMIVILRE